MFNGFEYLFYRDYYSNSSVDATFRLTRISNYILVQIWNVEMAVHQTQ